MPKKALLGKNEKKWRRKIVKFGGKKDSFDLKDHKMTELIQMMAT